MVQISFVKKVDCIKIETAAGRRIFLRAVTRKWKEILWWVQQVKWLLCLGQQTPRWQILGYRCFLPDLRTLITLEPLWTSDLHCSYFSTTSETSSYLTRKEMAMTCKRRANYHSHLDVWWDWVGNFVHRRKHCQRPNRPESWMFLLNMWWRS